MVRLEGGKRSPKKLNGRKSNSVLSMLKIFSMAFILLAAFWVPARALQAEQAAGRTEDIGAAIEYLIEAVAGSQLTFIRNGEQHSNAEAAGHIRRKYEYFKSRIESPEDFIRLCASKSLLSGKPYLVVTPQRTVAMESWLKQILAEYRSAQGAAAQ